MSIIHLEKFRSKYYYMLPSHLLNNTFVANNESVNHQFN